MRAITEDCFSLFFLLVRHVSVFGMNGEAFGCHSEVKNSDIPYKSQTQTQFIELSNT